MRIPIVLMAVLVLVSGCGGGGGGGGDGGGATGPAPYRVLDLATGAVTESQSLPDLTAASATSTQMVFRRVPAGSFTMGSPAGSLGAQSGEAPTTTSVGEFWIAVFELTQGQWLALSGRASAAPWQDLAPASVSGAGVTIANRPAFGVTHDELAALLTAWNVGKTGQLGIPAEAQWEFACRAGTSTLFYWGDSIDPAVAGSYAFCRETVSGAVGPGTVGGTRISNGLLLWDMHGNVREWVTTAAQPALRGGSWADNLLLSRSANRFTSVDKAFRHALSGARLVLTAP
jgi:formylglycine-generating enzyme required for sulfatase activity